MKLRYLAVPCFAALAAVAAPRAQSGEGNGIAFVDHTIATGLRGGYQVVVADLNRDGRPDVIAVAQGLPDLVWYENPGWQPHVIAGGMSQMLNVSVYDIDGDGIPEIALAHGFTTSPKTSKGLIGLLTHGADVTAPWTYKEIDAVPTAHRLRWVDPDGSGKKVLMMAPLVGVDSEPPDYKSPVPVFFYRAPDWKREIVTDTFTGLIHGLEPMPWEGVRGQAVLTAGFMGIYLHRFAGGKWTPTQLTKGDPQPWPKSGTSDVALGHLGSQKFLATIEPWHGNEVAIYTQAKAGWERHQIDDTLTDGHTIVIGDFDGDGRDEVITGQRGGVRSLIMYKASADGAAWTRRVIDEGGMAGAGCATADFNGDKKPDIVCIGSGTANLKWYENVTKK